MQAKRSRNLPYALTHRMQSGVMLMGLLIFIAIMGLVVTKSAEVWSTTLVREREQELLFVGEQYRAAIERYYYATPGANKVLPPTLDDLISDNRFPKPLHHLRRLYADPMTNSEKWGLLLRGNRIEGVHSTSDQTPMKKFGFNTKYTDFASAQSYRGWRFQFRPAATKAVGNPAPSSSAPRNNSGTAPISVSR